MSNEKWKMIRSHPPPQAGCPLEDPGPLAVLTPLPWHMLAYVVASFISGIDFGLKLFRLRFHRPVNMRRYEGHVVVVRMVLSIEDSNLLAHVFKDLALKRCFAHRQSGCVKAVLFVVGKSGRAVRGGSVPATAKARKSHSQQSYCQDRFHYFDSTLSDDCSCSCPISCSLALVSSLAG